MYNTTDVVEQQTGCPSGSVGSSVDKFSLQLSYPSIVKKNKWLLGNSSSGHTIRGCKSCLSSCTPVIIILAIGCTILLWVLALIADGQEEMRSCAALWPTVATVVFIAIIFVFLRCAEWCLKSRVKQKNQMPVEEPLGNRDSLKVLNREETSPENISVEPGKDHQHMCIVISYACLGFALFCVMIGSVIQYFSLESSCYKHLHETVSDLLLGYEVLVYTSVVILSVLGCFVLCLCLGIVINCWTSDILDATSL